MDRLAVVLPRCPKCRSLDVVTFFKEERAGVIYVDICKSCRKDFNFSYYTKLSSA